MRMVIDRNTGKRRKVDMKRSKAAVKGYKKRKNKVISQQTRTRIGKGVTRAHKKGKTLTGRRVKWAKAGRKPVRLAHLR